MCCNNEIVELINTDPYCSIGPYGYLLSALEQIGYIYRFYISYCTLDFYDNANCEKKRSKYLVRYENAMVFYNKYKNQITGGKKNKTRKRLKSNIHNRK